MDEAVFKFPYLSLAQCYRLSGPKRMEIVMGGDQMYWVVTPEIARELVSQGYRLQR
jgi:hypothetical protein